uniref:Uncharacterized protein n=1 Tax=Anguilla anguilla TaxID=7936 RepID=A0A0E9PJT6_ANGAN
MSIPNFFFQNSNWAMSIFIHTSLLHLLE